MSADESKIDTPTRQRLYEDQKALLHAACCARDEALAWVADLIHDRKAKGVGGALTAFDRLQERVERMEDRMSGNAHLSGISVTVNGIDLTQLQFSPAADTNGGSDG